MIFKKLRAAEAGDIHLGHPNTPTEQVIKSLEKAFPDTEETGLLDVIFFAGDLFDRLLNAPDANLEMIKMWIFRFLLMCAKRNISVRVLEGTPSHDWRQSQEFLTIQKLAGIKVDLKYIKELSIEHHPLGFTVLYVPDEWRPDTNDTYMEVCQLLREHGLEQVDFAVMHGAFRYQLPETAKVPTHVEERYLALVKHYIFIGHIHKHSTYERILAAGSLDRLAHGEEEPKGHLRVTIDPEHGDTITFVENKHAQLYLTIDCTGLTLEESFKKLAMANELPENSYLRVMADRDNPILVNMELLRRMYSHISWSTKTQLGETVQSSLLVDLRSQYEEIQLTQSNLPKLLEERMFKMGHPPDLIQRSLKLLEEAL